MNQLICLIPHYNNPQGLIKSLASIGNQECCDVLVVDDGSQKKPLDEVAARAAFKAQGEIHFLALPQNVGIENALNAGLNWILPRPYTYIARLDCGDENLPDRFARQGIYLEAHPEIALLGGAASFVDQDGQEQFVLRHPQEHKAIRQALKRNSAFIHPTVVMRRSALALIGGYPLDVRAAEDYALFWALAERFPCANLPEVLIRYELDPGGISLGKRQQQLRSRLKIQRQHLDHSLGAWLGILQTLLLLALPYRLIFALKSWLRRGKLQ